MYFNCMPRNHLFHHNKVQGNNHFIVLGERVNAIPRFYGDICVTLQLWKEKLKNAMLYNNILYRTLCS